MGDFNHKGNLSNLPIEYGDRIVVMVGIRKNVLDRFSLGFSFTPITLPIYGKYNDYGGIENVEKSPATEYMEEYFGMSAEEIIETAERVEADCADQVEEKNDAIMEKIGFADFKEYSLGYFMEHADVFDKMVEMGDVARSEHEFWGMPDWEEKFLEELGYVKKLISKGRNAGLGDNNEWHHDSLPALLQNETYFYLLNGPDKDYKHSLYPVCIGDICKFIGCEIPEKYSQSWLEWKFESDMNVKCPVSYDQKGLENMYFINSYDVYGFFHGGEYYDARFFALPFNTRQGGHLKAEYKREFVRFAAFINSMRTMNLTWGISNYYSQQCDYGMHKGFIDACGKVLEQKISDNEDLEEL